MSSQLAGFPHWELRFDEHGQLVHPEEQQFLLAELVEQQITDLFVLSHGWNNNREQARIMYEGFFRHMQPILNNQQLLHIREVKIGTVGIIWPSMRWADEDVPMAEGGAAAFDPPPSYSDAELLSQLKAVFPDARQQQAIDEMAKLLEQRPEAVDALTRFQALISELTNSIDATDAVEDNGEAYGLLGEDPLIVFERFGAEAQPVGGEGGAAVFGRPFRLLWAGAKEALRQATYWEMKKRAGVVGKSGLGSVIGRIRGTLPDIYIHLAGHSFGARLVSYALSGLPAGEAPMVRSLVLIQGAFSHWAFANSLPFDPTRSGALAGMQARVSGPVVVIHSEHDSALANFYPLASMAAGEDAAALDDILSRWGAMGHDGARGVSVWASSISDVGAAYPFSTSKFVNIDGSRVIASGRPPAGAHGDILHPELVWVVLAAAGILRDRPL